MSTTREGSTRTVGPLPIRVAGATEAGAEGRAGRVRSVDLVRGAVMVLMALDHVRVFAGIPAGGATAGLFFTRWVTHFCAPAFLFLAGTSAWLSAAPGDDPERRRRLSRFLLARGAWLVLLELTFLRWAWTFNADLMGYNLAGVIWVIGWCMVLLAGLIHLPRPALAAFALAVIAGHHALVPLLRAMDPAPDGAAAKLLQVLYSGAGGSFTLGEAGPRLVVLYSVVPWVGVIAAGYLFGAVRRMPPERRDRWCHALGGAAVAAFLLLRATGLYGDPGAWDRAGGSMPAALSFLNAAKYPASFQFLLMTLGPVLLLLPMLERARGRLAGWLEVFGRVPLFFYLLHVPLIHAVALAVSRVRLGEVSPWLFGNHPMEPGPVPEEYRWSLPLLYAVTAGVVVLLYFPCRWFARYRSTRRAAWLRYL